MTFAFMRKILHKACNFFLKYVRIFHDVMLLNKNY